MSILQMRIVGDSVSPSMHPRTYEYVRIWRQLTQVNIPLTKPTYLSTNIINTTIIPSYISGIERNVGELGHGTFNLFQTLLSHACRDTNTTDSSSHKIFHSHPAGCLVNGLSFSRRSKRCLIRNVGRYLDVVRTVFHVIDAG
jgi:hypothetical protein